MFLTVSFGATDKPILSSNYKQISEENQWKSLIHYYHGKSDITDQNFFIRGQFISLEDELKVSIEELIEKKNLDLICRFPARYYFLLKKLNLKNSLASLQKCGKLNEFLEKSPLEKMSLVFVAENISLPTSVMGHVFLKLAGENSSKEKIEHAISFFTDTENSNFFKLAFQSLLIGKDGLYGLAPFQQVKNNYVYVEKRNVWEFDLEVSDDDKKLIQLHLHELKEIKFNYFFHFYNCATFINSIMAISNQAYANDRTAWVTPLDVIRTVNRINHEQEVRFTPTSSWKLRAILDNKKLNDVVLDDIRTQHYNELVKYSTSEDYLFILFLAKSYNDYQFEENRISKSKWDVNDTLIHDLISNKNLNLDFSTFKSPTKLKPDSQIELGVNWKQDKRFYKFGFLPASHLIYDDNSHYLNESELKLGNISVELEKKLKICELVLYGVKSLVPSNPLLNSYSLKFELGYLNRLIPFSNISEYYGGELGIGNTFRYNKDIDLFLFANGQALYRYNNFYISLLPEIGMVIREIYGFKTYLTLDRSYYREVAKNFNTLNLHQVLNLGRTSYKFSMNFIEYKRQTEKSYNLSVKYIF